MKSFTLAITTFNRIKYLKRCIDSFVNTKNNSFDWRIIIADDGSTDGTLDYLEKLAIEKCDIKIIKNSRIGVHQQVNTILKKLETTPFDFCFKIDDDITFLKPGWDELYYSSAKNTGIDHLVFGDQNWCREQHLKLPIINNKLIGRVPMLHAHGFFYTITPIVLEKVGYMDVDSFGFRGMGHVDYTNRCARAGFTDSKTPWDVINSNDFIKAAQEDYKSVLPPIPTATYDEFNRKQKESIIADPKRVYISFSEINHSLLNSFQKDLILALTEKVERFEVKKAKEIDWYKNEMNKITDWYTNQFDHLPKWFIKMGKLFKLLEK